MLPRNIVAVSNCEVIKITIVLILWWIPRLIAQLEKKLFGIPDFFIAFGSPIDAKIMDIFGFGRGPPNWPQGTVKFLLFFKICWRCITLEDHTTGSGWPIWTRVCLLERSDSLLLGKNMKFGIFSDFGSNAMFDGL